VLVLQEQLIHELAQRAMLELRGAEGADEGAHLGEPVLEQLPDAVLALQNLRVDVGRALQRGFHEVQLRKGRIHVLHRAIVDVEEDALELPLGDGEHATRGANLARPGVGAFLRVRSSW
jgi:hypothetical protein